MATENAIETMDLGSWYLEGYVDDGKVARRYALNSLPFRIGRRADANAAIPLDPVSSLHAEIYTRDGKLWLRDLHSSNGTFKNGERVTQDVPVGEGDILHFAHIEFVLGREVEAPECMQTSILRASELIAANGHAANANALRDLIGRRRIIPHFQPVVEFSEPGNLAFELLGRGDHATLPDSPSALFELAERLGLEVELSGLFRWEGLKLAAALPGNPNVFINTHPAEMQRKTLVSSLRYAREQMPALPITVEIHEASITDPAMMRALRTVLSDLDMRLAYDDFGAGQARLVELVEVPPDFLKFDISLIHGIDSAPAAHQKMLAALVEMVTDLGIACVAEGIEQRAELTVCRQMGFAYGQGYLLGRPAPVERWRQRKAG